MKKLLRICFSILALLIVIAAGAAICLFYFVDPNQLKPILANEVYTRTGYILTTEGNFSWRFYPRLSVQCRHMMLSAPHQTQPFADLYDVSIATQLAQLLHGDQQLKGTVRIGSMTYMNIQTQTVTVDLHWQNQVLTLQPLKATLYGGTLEGVIQGNHFSGVPQWRWNIHLDNIQLKTLLTDMTNGKSKLSVSGTAQLDFAGSTQGQDKTQIIRAINGHSEFNVTQGAVEGVNLNYFVDAANALLNKQPVPPPADLNHTVFDHLTGAAEIRNGAAAISALVLTAPAFTVKGAGVMDILNQTLDAQLDVTPAHLEKIQWAIPVALTGSLQNPSVRLDVAKIQTQIAVDKLDKIKTKVEEQIKKLPEKADKLIKNILGD